MLSVPEEFAGQMMKCPLCGGVFQISVPGQYLQHPSDVGSYLPNPLGIYDLHGNVWEWTSSVYEGGPDRVFRGGYWDYGGAGCAASNRGRYEPGLAGSSVGFRLLAVPTS